MPHLKGEKVIPLLNPVSQLNTPCNHVVSLVVGGEEDKTMKSQYQCGACNPNRNHGLEHLVSHQPSLNSSNEAMKFKHEIRLEDLNTQRIKKRSSLTLSKKMEILKRLKQGESQGSVARSLTVNRSTIQNVWENRKKFEQAAQNGNANRKKFRMPMSLELEKSLVDWIEDLNSKGLPPNGPQIKERARASAVELGLSDFFASSGWLENFKHRNNIILLKSKSVRKESHVLEKEVVINSQSEDVSLYEDDILKEPSSSLSISVPKDANGDNEVDFNYANASKKTRNKWLSKNCSLLSECYDPENIFYLHEFGLFYKTLPENYTSLQGLSCLEGEFANERLSILCRTNIIGSEKSKLLAVGCSSSPQSFGQTWNRNDQKRLPTEYWHHRKAWISRDIFSSYLKRWNGQLQLTGRKVVLLMDDSSLHRDWTKEAECTFVKIILLPTGLSPQLRSTIAYEIKKNYRRMLLNKQIFKRNESPEEVSILDALGMLHTAWAAVNKLTIIDFFKKSPLFRNLDASCTSLQTKAEERSTIRSLMHSARSSRVVFPKELSFQNYIDIDKNLTAVDGVAPLEKSDIPKNNEPHLCTNPSMNIINNLDHLRNWAVLKGQGSDLGKLHDAISTVQNFCMRNIRLLNNSTHPHLPALNKMDCNGGKVP